jgi:hypothetical protein
MRRTITHHKCGHEVNEQNTYRHTLPSGEKVVVCRRCKSLKQYAGRQKLRITIND